MEEQFLMSLTKEDREITNYIEQMKEVYELFLIFIENPDPYANEDFWNLIQIMDKIGIHQNKELFNNFIGILINVSNNHHRQTGFFDKIERIISKYKDSILQNNTNIEIYQDFESNKRLIYFLIKEGILKIDINIIQLIKSKIETNGIFLSNFFLTEISKNDEKFDFKNILFHYSNSIEEYDKNRQIGENHSYVSSLIRQDSIEEFVSFVNRTNFSLSSKIKQSIFETNQFLIGKEPTLIEYAAFFGSIQIFQFLYLNQVKVTDSMWLYAIHSNNSDFLINYIERNQIKPKNNNYKEVLIESIKCHHNEIARYIQDNFINDEMMNAKVLNIKTSFNEILFGNIFNYYNYSFFPDEFNQNYAFYYFYKFYYITIVEYLIQSKKELILNETDIQEAAKNDHTEVLYCLLSAKEEIKENSFNRNRNLTRIAIPPSIKTICKESFYECSSLYEITIPYSVTTIEEYAFGKCSSISQISIPLSVTYIGEGAFRECSSLKQISIPLFITSIENYVFRGCASLTTISIPQYVKSIGDFAFSECSSLLYLIIPSSVTSIGVSAFSNCSSLIQIIIPSSVTSIKNYTFDKCNKLARVILPSSVTSIGNFVFNSCSSLRYISIPSSVTSIGDFTFNNCNSLIKISMTNSVTSIGKGAFNGCTSLQQFLIPFNLNTINDNLFNDCSSLNYISIPPSASSIGNYAFCGCFSLIKVYIPSSVISIGDHAFSNCRFLSQISIPASVNSIGNGAFAYCSSLKQILIHSSGISIGNGAFFKCDALDKLSIPSSLELDVKLSGLKPNVNIERF